MDCWKVNFEFFGSKSPRKCIIVWCERYVLLLPTISTIRYAPFIFTGTQWYVVYSFHNRIELYPIEDEEMLHMEEETKKCPDSELNTELYEIMKKIVPELDKIFSKQDL